MSSPCKSDVRKKIGSSGEIRAREFFVKNGYEILASNFRTRSGEIDFIAFKENTVVFVEVKTLVSGTADILSKVLNPQKQKRIVETAKYFLSINRKYNNSFVRFDVVVIDMPGFPDVYHIENAFSEFLE